MRNRNHVKNWQGPRKRLPRSAAPSQERQITNSVSGPALAGRSDAEHLPPHSRTAHEQETRNVASEFASSTVIGVIFDMCDYAEFVRRRTFWACGLLVLSLTVAASSSCKRSQLLVNRLCFSIRFRRDLNDFAYGPL